MCGRCLSTVPTISGAYSSPPPAATPSQAAAVSPRRPRVGPAGARAANGRVPTRAPRSGLACGDDPEERLDVVGLDRAAARRDHARLGGAYAQLGRLLDHMVHLLERREQLLVIVGSLGVLSDQTAVERVELRIGGAHRLDVAQDARVLGLDDERLGLVARVGHLGGELESRRVELVHLEQDRAEALHLLREVSCRLQLGDPQRGAQVLQHLPRQLNVLGVDVHRAAAVGRHSDPEQPPVAQRDETLVERLVLA
mmetsp:Transcript_36172/g.105869  ORF Transcript_36172/g.105869 Transcript_36172/m.105869 type:complete len:254 (-) Transcript_36172:1626-2387(-)